MLERRSFHGLLVVVDVVYHEGRRSGDRLLRCVVSRDVTAPIGPTEKISVALLVNVLHYREEEKLDVVESRASVRGCRSIRRCQRSLLWAE